MVEKFRTIKNKPIIYDNVLPPMVTSRIEDICTKFLFYQYSAETSIPFANNRWNNDILNNIKEGPQIVATTFHDIFSLNTGKDILVQKSEDLYYCERNNRWNTTLHLPFIFSFLDLGLQFFEENVIRTKVNMAFKQDENYKNKIQTPHSDQSDQGYEWITGIYYVNDSDGDTLIFNEEESDLDEKGNNNLTILEKISPKKGRLVLFNGKKIHVGSHPTEHTNRIVINFNYRLDNLNTF